MVHVRYYCYYQVGGSPASIELDLDIDETALSCKSAVVAILGTHLRVSSLLDYVALEIRDSTKRPQWLEDCHSVLID